MDRWENQTVLRSAWRIRSWLTCGKYTAEKHTHWWFLPKANPSHKQARFWTTFKIYHHRLWAMFGQPVLFHKYLKTNNSSKCIPISSDLLCDVTVCDSGWLTHCSPCGKMASIATHSVTPWSGPFGYHHESYCTYLRQKHADIQRTYMYNIVQHVRTYKSNYVTIHEMIALTLL